MNDNSLMPFGKHKGKPLIKVPASYLLWLYDNWAYDNNPAFKELKKYIENNLDALKLEIKKK